MAKAVAEAVVVAAVVAAALLTTRATCGSALVGSLAILMFWVTWLTLLATPSVAHVEVTSTLAAAKTAMVVIAKIVFSKVATSLRAA